MMKEVKEFVKAVGILGCKLIDEIEPFIGVGCLLVGQFITFLGMLIPGPLIDKLLLMMMYFLLLSFVFGENGLLNKKGVWNECKKGG